MALETQSEYAQRAYWDDLFLPTILGAGLTSFVYEMSEAEENTFLPENIPLDDFILFIGAVIFWGYLSFQAAKFRMRRLPKE